MSDRHEVWRGESLLEAFEDGEAAEALYQRLSGEEPGGRISLRTGYKVPPDYDPIASVRSRPAMYVGSTTERGCLQLLLEVAANAIDQSLQARATRVEVRVEGQSFEVFDNGAGLSVEKARTHLSETHFSATADRHAPHVHMTFLGVGLCPVNALCSRFVMESFDSKGGWRLEFREGRFHSEEQIARPEGTTVRANFDPSIFGNYGVALPHARRIFFDSAHLFPGLRLTLNEETFHAPGGLLDMASFESAHRESRANWADNGKKFGYEHHDESIFLTFACVGDRSDKPPTVNSWVNGVLTPDHGTHVEGAQDALRRVGWKPAVIMLHVVLNKPQYAGPCKDKLDTPEIRALVREALTGPLQQHRAGSF